MPRWPWGVLSGASLFLAGCEKPPRAPIPPIDAVVPTQTETATFALG